MTKIAIVAGAVIVRAAPSAVAMKGAVQGVATTAASAPVKYAPFAPPLVAMPSPTPATEVFTSNTPDRLRPTSSSR